MAIWDKGIVVDAAHSEKNKRTEYQGVNLETGEIIFYNDIGYQTTNIGEFLALVDGIKYIIDHNVEPGRVFSDSNVAIAWVKRKAAATNKFTPAVAKAETYLKACSSFIDGIEIIKWDNKKWGENPADFGRK